VFSVEGLGFRALGQLMCDVMRIGGTSVVVYTVDLLNCLCRRRKNMGKS